MRLGVIFIIFLVNFAAGGQEAPIYSDGQFVERIALDERGREVLSFVDYDGLPITGTVMSSTENENKTFQVIDGKAEGAAKIEFIEEKMTEIENDSDGSAPQEDDIVIVIQKNKRVMEIPYQHGIKDGTVFIWDKNGNLLNEQIYGAGVKTAESFYDKNGQMVKYVQYFPNDRVVPLSSIEKNFNENGQMQTQIEKTYHDNGLLQQRIETTFDKDGRVVSTYSSSYDLEGHLFDALFQAQRSIEINIH